MATRYSRALWAGLIAVVLLIGCRVESESSSVGDGTAAVESAESSGPPPLVVDTSEPLLLEEPDKEAAAHGDNQTCLVCHANYANEQLAATHLGRDVTCASCHGDSIRHKNDENNTTPPDKMYPNDRIRALCATCHEPHRITAANIRERLDRNPKQVVINDLVCTDCHGEHRMKLRTVIWDKRTGKLINTNRGE